VTAYVCPFRSRVHTDGLHLFVDTDSIYLSKATKLRDAVFVCNSHPGTITTALRTAGRNHKDFQQLSIGAPGTVWRSMAFDPSPHPILPESASVGAAVGKGGYLAWLELDRVLVQLHESHSIRPKVLVQGDKQTARSWMECLLPEVVIGGIADLEESHDIFWDIAL
jgi:hypothetical protein